MATRNEIELLIKARDEASRSLADITSRIQALESSGRPAGVALDAVSDKAKGVGTSVTEMATGMALGQAAFYAMQKAADLTFGTFIKGIKNIDDLRLAQASMASAAATNEPTKAWNEIYTTTGRIVEKIYELDRAFIGTGDELLMLSDSMVTFGMGIDLSTKKQQDQFVAFGNLLKMMTKGQDFQRQAYQEIRALMEGADVQGALLVKKLEAAGINVKQMVPAWREQGVLLEKIMETLPGYLLGSKEVEKTLQAQKTSLETITFKILREGLAPAYENITALVKGINDSLLDQNGLTEKGRAVVELLQLGWDAVATSVKIAGKAIEAVVAPLGWIYDRWKEITASGGSTVAPIEGAWAEAGTTPWEEAFSPTPWKVAPRKSFKEQNAAVQAQVNWSESMAAEMGYGSEVGLKLGAGHGMDDTALKAAESIAKKIEALYDKIAIEAARKRGGDMEAELEKARIDYINRNRDLLELQEKGKVPADERAEQLRVSEMEYQVEREKIITKAEERIAAEVDKIRKHVDAEEEKARQKRLHDIAKNAEAELELLIKQEEKATEILEKYAEMQRYYSERAPRPWDRPGEKDRQKAFHDFEMEKNALDALRRKGEAGLAGGISAEQYDQAMEALVEVHKERLGQIEDATDEATNRQARLWEEMFSGMNATFSDVFFDAFSGKLKTMSDYFETALNVMRRAWANFLSDMMTKQLEAQFQGGGGISGFLSKLFGGGGGATGWAGTAENSAIAMDVEHLGMYGLKEGGIFPGGFVPIRAFASGGIADRPTLGLIGEGGGPEAVIPLKGGKVPVDLRGQRGGGDLNINFQIAAIDSRSVRQMLIEERGTLTGIIRNEIVNAGMMRDAVRSR